ncbi:hypothetical protein QYF36_011535 [Acer negundo]|nr:hypothetical protein QYF36_011535 [Acer negundo]
MKSQVLADFIADFTPCENLKAEKELVTLTDDTTVEKWTLSVDGSSHIKGSGLGLVLKSPQGDIMEQSIHCGFRATNNEAEYEALIARLDLAKSLNVRNIKVLSNSQLVIRQLNETYEARDRRMSAYLNKVKHLQSTFDEFSIEQIPRAENTRADALASLGSTTTKQFKVGSHSPPHVPIYSRIRNIGTSRQRVEARKIKAKSAKFCILYGKLYKKSFTGPYLRCVTPREVYDVLKSLHYEECGSHSSPRSLSNRAITAGYYWPTIRTDSQNHVKSCDKCQRFATVSHLTPGMLNSISAPWPFMKWGMNIVGKLPAAPGGVVYMLVLTDYFTKWVETGAYQQIRDIEKRLEAEKSEWAEKLPEILWSYRTTPRRSTRETPFSLVYGSEAVIPIETRLSTARSENPDNEQNNLELSFELDHFDEKRDRAALRIQSYQQQVARHYNKKVRTRVFKLHDWVLQRVFQNTKEEGARKLGPTWEGPYQITDVIGRGAYKLRGHDGRELHNSWNALHLKRYHF